MLREVLATAWAQSPRQVVAAVLLTPVAMAVGYVLLVFAIIAGSPS